MRKIVIWGTGKLAKGIMREILEIRAFAPNVCQEFIDSIDCFVDMDKAKQGTSFFDVIVKSPDEVVWDKNKFFCLVAVRNADSILDFLYDKACWLYGHDFETYTDFLRNLRKKLSQNANCSNSFVSLIETIKKDINKGMSVANIYQKAENVSASAFVSAISSLYGENIQTLSDILSDSEFPQPRARKIKTIGIMAGTYSGGGGERAVSRLIPIYLQMGYEVVLFKTGDTVGQEYVLPDSVPSVTLPMQLDASMFFNMKTFFDALTDNVKRYDVHVMCFHLPYEGTGLFYMVVLMKLLGIRTLVKCCTSMAALFAHKRVASCSAIYPLLDRLVVLSRADQILWSYLGCNCTFVPNPCEDMSVTSNGAVTANRKGKTVLWVGRLVNKAKQYFDLVPIMRQVVDCVEDACLLIVGGVNDVEEYADFNRLVSENRLQDKIVFCGPQNEMQRFYMESDVLVMTSPYEGFPNVMAEAMSCSLPIVMYEIPSVELAHDNDGVWKVPQRDTNTAAEAIIRILKDDKIRHFMAKESRKAIEPYIRYDVGGDWMQIFNDITRN